MRGAHTKGWRECEIGEPEIGGYLLDQALYSLNVTYLLSQVDVQDRPACVFCLQFTVSRIHLAYGNFDIGVKCFDNVAQTVGHLPQFNAPALKIRFGSA